MDGRIDCTPYGEEELSLHVFNTERFYRKRHQWGLADWRRHFKFNWPQWRDFQETLRADKDS